MSRAALAAICLVLAACDPKAQIEAPPPEYAAGPYTATTVVTRDVDAVCQALNGPLPGRYVECYAPRFDVMIVPCDDASAWCESITAHAQGHARGWRHR